MHLDSADGVPQTSTLVRHGKGSGREEPVFMSGPTSVNAAVMLVAKVASEATRRSQMPRLFLKLAILVKLGCRVKYP